MYLLCPPLSQKVLDRLFGETHHSFIQLQFIEHLLGCRVNEWMGTWVGGQMDGRKEGKKEEGQWVVGWLASRLMGGWVDGWKEEEWRGRWIEGWMEGQRRDDG